MLFVSDKKIIKPKTYKQIAGTKAYRYGDMYEIYFKNLVESEGFAYIQLPRAGGKFTGKNTSPFLKKICCDFIVGYEHRTALIDVKTTEKKSYTYSLIHSNQEQYRTLTQFVYDYGCHTAGYLVFFRSLDVCVYFDVVVLSGVLPRNGLSPMDGTFICSLNSAYERSNLKHIFQKRPISF